jgi:hypothetical protein
MRVKASMKESVDPKASAAIKSPERLLQRRVRVADHAAEARCSLRMEIDSD